MSFGRLRKERDENKYINRCMRLISMNYRYNSQNKIKGQ